MSIGEYIKRLRLNKGLSQEELGRIVGVQRAAVQKWEAGITTNLKRETIQKLSSYFDVSPATFIEDELSDEKQRLIFLNETKLYNAPLFESVSAGFGATAINEVIEYVPVVVKSEEEAKNTICIKVEGDSMTPDIKDGDVIQVRKQTSVDNGDIAVVRLDGSEHLVKRVLYDDENIKLISLNMNYKPIVLKGPDVQRCEIVGKVKKVMRDV